MSIQSDRQIRALCERTPDNWESELPSFQPMIEPFVREQVRYRLRKPTLEEMPIFSSYTMLTQEQQMAELKRVSPSAMGVEYVAREEGDHGQTLRIQDQIISYGLSSYGYDVRIADEFKIFTNVSSTVLNPKNFDERNYVDFKGDVCIIPPNSFVLARSVEYIRMPRKMTGLVLSKSTYARCGINCLATPLEAEWEGTITLEYANTTPLPAMLFANEGAAQVLFFEGNDACDVSYKDRGGKYQGQTGITLPRT